MPNIDVRNWVGRRHYLDKDQSEARRESHRRLRWAQEELAKTAQYVLGAPAYPVITVECDATVVSPNKGDFTLQGEGEHQALPVFKKSPIIMRIDVDEVVPAQATEKTPDNYYGRQIEIVTKDHRHDGKPVDILALARTLEILPALLADKANDKEKYGDIVRIDYNSVPFAGFYDQASACQFNVNLELPDSGKPLDGNFDHRKLGGLSVVNLFGNGEQKESCLHLLFVDEMMRFQTEGGLLVYTPTESAYERLKRHGPTEPDAHFISERKARGNFPTIFTRGPNRDVARMEDPRRHKHEDSGGVRTELRFGSPECLTLDSVRSPSLALETILRVMQRALERYECIPKKNREDMKVEELWQRSKVPFPSDYKTLKHKFEESPFIGGCYGGIRNRALEIIEGKEKTASHAR